MVSVNHRAPAQRRTFGSFADTMSHPSLATHMVSLPDGKAGNNALGYCTSTALHPDRTTTLTPLGPAWARWALKGTKVVVKWLRVAGQPECLHVLDGETSTTSRLPRRLLQRLAEDVVTIRTLDTQHSAAGVALHYGSASALVGNTLSVTALGPWQCTLPAGSAVEIFNLSVPGDRFKNGAFGSQSSIVSGSFASVRFLKDRRSWW